jgi:hypothetical protein
MRLADASWREANSTALCEVGMPLQASADTVRNAGQLLDRQFVPALGSRSPRGPVLAHHSKRENRRQQVNRFSIRACGGALRYLAAFEHPLPKVKAVKSKTVAVELRARYVTFGANGKSIVHPVILMRSRQYVR